MPRIPGDDFLAPPPLPPPLLKERKALPLHIREERLRGLAKMVQGCRACPAMEGRRRVLSEKNGRAASKVLFVAEAPGRNGADRTGVPIHGDPTGNNFERLLQGIGWKREEVFVTNAVLCNPRDEKGNNRPPNEEESRNCSYHLQSQILTVDPLVVVTLGAKPLAALGLIEPHSFTLSRDVGKTLWWCSRYLFPLYHPSPRALIHRSFTVQAEDFRKLVNLVKSIGSA